MIFCLVSSYREGRSLMSTVRSAQPAADMIYVLEGPVGATREEEPAGDPSPLQELQTLRNVVVAEGSWEDEAEKRTDALAFAKLRHSAWYAMQEPCPAHGITWAPGCVDCVKAQAGLDDREPDPLWILHLDGDEILLWGEYLQDMTDRAEHQTDAGGFGLRLVELDGSVVKCHGKIVRGELIKRYVVSSFQAEMESGIVVDLPNVPLCASGGVPVNFGSQALRIEDLATLRPPLAGEPHILHRSMLRSPERTARRLHLDERDILEGKAT